MKCTGRHGIGGSGLMQSESSARQGAGSSTPHFPSSSVFQPVVSLKFAPSGLKDQPKV